MTQTIMFTSKSKEYGWLSNFWPCRVKHRDIVYPSVEHFYQAQKTKDRDIQRFISKLDGAWRAKRFGSDLTSIRPDWDGIKLKVMRHGLTEKFKNADLARKLQDTGKIKLVEMVYWCDRFWGVCHCVKCHGKGRNELGKLLMEIRKETGGK